MAGTPNKVQMPKDALSRVNLGQSFAEYDKVLSRPGVFVRTPAVEAALDGARSKCFFVGRRGTGKTALTCYLTDRGRTTFAIHPNVLAPRDLPCDIALFHDVKQRPLRSLTAAFELAIAMECASQLIGKGIMSAKALEPIGRERNLIEQHDMDTRLLTLFEDTLSPLQRDEKEWLRQIKRSKNVTKEIDDIIGASANEVVLLIDRIDEAWDGSDKAVVCLMAMMHACVELSSRLVRVRPLLFVRENIFERVRQIDTEFSRLETCVVSLDWSNELLLELVERRLVLPFSTKPAIGGPAWSCFFEDDTSVPSQQLVFDYCQQRPRDVLSYCAMAIETAQSRKRQRVHSEDLLSARRKFSESRLKDLGDEYSENYPRINLVLSRFFGLGVAYTISGVADMVKLLLVDHEIKKYCSQWLYQMSAPEQFMQLLFNIGFAGIKNGKQLHFRSVGARSPTPPAITPNSTLVVHNSFIEALNLQDVVINTLEGRGLKTEGVVEDLPESISLSTYMDEIKRLQEELQIVKLGRAGDTQFETIVGDVIRYCFFKSLSNVQPKVRDIDGATVKDWVASNVAQAGFWEMLRTSRGATQIVFECKNYEKLSASDFHQTAYYMNDNIGRVVFVVFRGEIEKSYFKHIQRIAAQSKGLVLLLNDSDLQVFLRQASNGKVKDGHLRDRYDMIIREIS